MNTSRFCLPWLHDILRLTLKGDRRRQLGPSCCQDGALRKGLSQCVCARACVRACVCVCVVVVVGFLQAGEEPARICLKSLHFPWTD